MAYQKLQVSRATEVATITSDTENTLNLNDPITLTSNALTAGTTGVTLIAAAATFITDGITAGDLVVNTTNKEADLVFDEVVSKLEKFGFRTN